MLQAVVRRRIGRIAAVAGALVGLSAARYREQAMNDVLTKVMPRGPVRRRLGRAHEAGGVRSVAARAVASCGLVACAFALASGSAAAHHPRTGIEEPNALRSPSMSLQASTFACDGDPEGKLENHGGDIAFWGDTAVLACSGDDESIADDGFAILDVADPRHPRTMSLFACTGGASDVAIWGDLVFTAVDTNQESGPPFAPGPVEDASETPARPSGACDAEVKGRVPGNVDENRFAGIHIISIADRSRPVQVGAVATNTLPDGRRRGVHGLSLVPDLANGRLVIYAAVPGQSKMDIVEVPLDRPSEARVVPDDTDDKLKFVSPTAAGCHDIAIFLPRRLAACSSPAGNPRETTQTVLYRIDDPLRPERVGSASATPSNGRRDHSATFSWDGETMIVTDENLASVANGQCKRDGGLDQGALWFYDVRDPSLPRFLGSQGPHPVAGADWCHPKQLNVVPLPSGDDVLVASWVGGGTTVVDFTGLNSSSRESSRPPREVAHYVVPRDGTAPLVAPNRNRTLPWSSYWHNGFVYANNAHACLAAALGCLGTKERGLDVFALDFRLDASLPTADRRRLNDAFEQALDLPWHNSYVQDCLPRPFGDAHGSGEAYEQCSRRG